MELIALLIAWAIIHYRKVPEWMQHDVWYEDWCSRLGNLPGGFLRLGLALTFPVLGSYLLLDLVDGWVFGLLPLSLAVGLALYSFGRVDLRAAIAAIADDVERGDSQAIYHRLEELDPELDIEDGTELPVEVVKTLYYAYLEQVFAVAFWFFVLGPPAALLYRLLWLSANSRSASGGSASSARRWLYWMEWLPVRGLSLMLALMGNFTGSIGNWLSSLLSAGSSRDVLGRFVDTVGLSFEAVSSERVSESIAQELAGPALAARTRELESLFFRCMLAWLAFAAIITVSF